MVSLTPKTDLSILTPMLFSDTHVACPSYVIGPVCNSSQDERFLASFMHTSCFTLCIGLWDENENQIISLSYVHVCHLHIYCIHFGCENISIYGIQKHRITILLLLVTNNFLYCSCILKKKSPRVIEVVGSKYPVFPSQNISAGSWIILVYKGLSLLFLAPSVYIELHCIL